MNSLSRREHERQMLRSKILVTARRLFAERGFAAVTIRSIADAIDYSPRTIYLYFKDKEDLIRQLCLENFLAFGKTQQLLLSIEDPVQRLHRMGQSYVEFAVQHPHHYRLMFMSPSVSLVAPGNEGEPVPAKDPDLDSYAMFVGTVQEAMDQGRLRPEFEDADLVAQVLWAGLHGVVAQHLSDNGVGFVPWRSLEQRVAMVQDIMIQGVIRA